MNTLLVQALLGTLLVLAAATSGAAEKAQAAAEATHGGNYQIGPADVLQVSIYGDEALSRTVPVRPDGMISLPLLNDVKAAGLTPMELRENLARRFVEFVPAAEVSVIVIEIHSPMVSVIGEVMKPGRYDLSRSTTVVDALALAGGFKEFASPSEIVVLRREGDGRERRIPFDFKNLKGKGAQANFPLRAGDIVLVP